MSNREKSESLCDYLSEFDGTEVWVETDTAVSVHFDEEVTSASEVFRAYDEHEESHEFGVAMLLDDKLQFQLRE